MTTPTTTSIPTQQINLEKGENWVSINVNLNINSIYKIFKNKPLSDGDLIKTKNNKVKYNKKEGWIGNLKTIEGGKMYIIYVSNPMTLLLKGTYIGRRGDIHLKMGENWINYNDTNKEIYKVLKNASENDYVIHKKFRIYYKDGQWTQNDNLTHFEAGKGYIIYSQKEFTHSLNINTPANSSQMFEVVDKKEDFILPEKNNTIYYIILCIIVIIVLFLFFRSKSKK